MTALNETVAALRTNMTELRSEPISVSFAEGLRQTVQDPRLSALMSVELSIDLPENVGFNTVQSTHILSILSEALTNAARHGRPSAVKVNVFSENGCFVLCVRDDGMGFRPNHAYASGYGLRNMRDRARLLGGVLQIESDSGQGSSVTLSVPWEAR